VRPEWRTLMRLLDPTYISYVPDHISFIERKIGYQPPSAPSSSSIRGGELSVFSMR
jgi:hypothetical protein